MEKYQKKIIGFYGGYDEHGRLQKGIACLERARTEIILKRFLPKPPAVIVDIGGGTGAYAFPLARKGYTVHLIDLAPNHVEKARLIEKSSRKHLATISVGDARSVSLKDGVADVVLLLGPLYHITDRKDRLRALKEAYRILKPRGLVFAAGISRFTSFIDGIRECFIKDREFLSVVKKDLRCGQHRNPKSKPNYFTTAFFHHPGELRNEVETAGFTVTSQIAIEGLAWLTSSFDEYWKDPKLRKNILFLIERTENEPSVLGASAHIMVVAKK